MVVLVQSQRELRSIHCIVRHLMSRRTGKVFLFLFFHLHVYLQQHLHHLRQHKLRTLPPPTSLSPELRISFSPTTDLALNAAGTGLVPASYYRHYGYGNRFRRSSGTLHSEYYTGKVLSCKHLWPLSHLTLSDAKTVEILVGRRVQDIATYEAMDTAYRRQDTPRHRRTPNRTYDEIIDRVPSGPGPNPGPKNGWEVMKTWRRWSAI
ncbi:hypothetical protein EX30DRAFT_351396 [Ascodesmis nigricans]|uniref:Uncharacterized protein n=1 Tax=Ascodesmis nigricans TaxID=341454 RepID=A0A4S2MLZ6_9PEZI|nr:hypothetical protein EX30DRAFT_351396 [Ascodesmis nigricans]